MSLTNRTRKLLWGQSGNRCAICKKELVVESTVSDDESIVGEECHIVSSQPTGPRHRSDFPAANIDSYGNLILLCRTHHRVIDDQVVEYSESNLNEIKKKHELWVKDSLEQGTIKPIRLRSIKGQKIEFLFRIASGKQLFNMLLGSCGSYLDHPDPADESEVELFGCVLENIQDWAALSEDLQAGDRVKARYQLSTIINELAEAGFWLFGNSEMKVLEGGVGVPSNWRILYISIVRCDNPGIVTIDLSPEAQNSA